MVAVEKEKKLTQQEVVRLERDLAKFANMMDSVVRIPFTKQGVGADAALSTIPVAGDVAGFALTCYAIYKAKQIGVPQSKLNSVMKLAMMDAVIGFIPVMWFSRYREYRADEAGARLAGKQAMISALLRLQAESELPDQMPKEMKAFAITEGKEQGFSLAALFQTHPTIEQRVAALQQLNCP